MKLDRARRFFKLDVNNPATINITPWPIANKNNIIIASNRFLPIAAKAIMPANIGVEQGVPTSANVIPSNIGYKNIELVELFGMFLIITGNSKSRMFKSFNPIINSMDAIISVKYPPRADAKTFPVKAQAIPIIVNTIAVPKIKQHSCKNVLNGDSFE